MFPWLIVVVGFPLSLFQRFPFCACLVQIYFVAPVFGSIAWSPSSPVVAFCEPRAEFKIEKSSAALGGDVTFELGQ